MNAAHSGSLGARAWDAALGVGLALGIPLSSPESQQGQGELGVHAGVPPELMGM